MTKKTARSSRFLFAFITILTLVLGLSAYQLYSSLATPATVNLVQSSFSPTLYVAENGSDTNPGTATSPLRTLGSAIARSQPGDIISVGPGTYRENLKIKNKSGTPSAPIYIVGSSSDPSQYPLLDGGDPGYTKTAENPSISLENSSWLVFERLAFRNSSLSSIFLSGSHYITIRRNLFDYHQYAILNRDKSSHLLIEYNDFRQSYPEGSTWTELKGSRWEGGGYVSFGGAGMSIIRYNRFHDSFNGIYTYRNTRVGNYYDANLWIYHNRFENIVDDPFEPESYAFNNHFFNNTLVNTHRLVSFAPAAQMLGPVYIYHNQLLIKTDPTLEASTGRKNSAYKLELNNYYYPNGVYTFNNSIDYSQGETNTYGLDLLNPTLNNFTHLNHAYQINKPLLSKSLGTLTNSQVQLPSATTNVGFANAQAEDFRLLANSPLRSQSVAVTAPLGFSDNRVVAAGQDLGAYQYGQNTFRSAPSPIYVAPPGGEDPSFPSNQAWPADLSQGPNPLFGPIWSNSGDIVAPPLPTPQPSIKATPTPTPTPTSVPTLTPTPKPSLTPTPSPVSGQTTRLEPIADVRIKKNNPDSNYGRLDYLALDNSPIEQSYLSFDLTPYRGRRLTSATLHLYAISTANKNSTQQIRYVPRYQLEEMKLTYNTRPASSILLTEFNGGKSRMTHRFALPTDTLNQLLGNELTLHLLNKTSDGINFASRESDHPPILELSFE